MHVIHMLSRQYIDYKIIINKARKYFNVDMKNSRKPYSYNRIMEPGAPYSSQRCLPL